MSPLRFGYHAHFPNLFGLFSFLLCTSRQLRHAIVRAVTETETIDTQHDNRP